MQIENQSNNARKDPIFDEKGHIQIQNCENMFSSYFSAILLIVRSSSWNKKLEVHFFCKIYFSAKPFKNRKCVLAADICERKH